MLTSRSLWGAALAAVVVAAPAARAIDSSCPADLQALFRVVGEESQGIWVTDRAVALGGAVADEKFHNRLLNAFMPLPGWYPVDGTKRIVCGGFEYWKMYPGPRPELDLHAYIVPSRSFRPIIDDLPPYGTIDGDRDHVWGEVTPPEWFAPFWRVDDVSLVPGQDNECGVDKPEQPRHACRATLWTGSTACMYGPWVMERIYHYRVEIHPAQILWGRDGDVVRVFVLSDDSKRFAQRRSYRRLTAVDGFMPWNAAVSPLIWVAAGATAPASLSIDVKRGPLSAVQTPATISTAIDLDGVSVKVSHPRDLQIGRGPACKLPSGQTRGFISVSAASGTTLDAIDVSGDILRQEGVSESPVVHQGESPAAIQPERPDDQEAPILDLTSVEWASPAPLQRTITLPRTRADWGFTDADRPTWTVARTQRLRLQVRTKSGSPPPANSRFWVNWDIEVCDVESGSVCTGVALGTGNDEVYLEVARGARVGITVPDGAIEKKDSNPHELIVFVRYPVPREFGDGFVTSSIRIKLTATLTDARGRTAAFTHVLRNIAPDFSSAIQPYSVETQGGAIPAVLTQFAVGWLRQQGVAVTRAELERDWTLRAASANEVLGPLGTQLRRRAARVLRLSLLTFLEDETLDAEEMIDVFEMLRNYATAVWAS